MVGVTAVSTVPVSAANLNTGYVGNKKLKDIASAKGILYGTSALYKDLVNDPVYAALVARESKVIIPEDSFRWRSLRPSINEFNWKELDWFMEYAKKNNLQVRGHALIFQDQFPEWFNTQVTPENAREVLVNHIKTVATRYKGQINAWEVVNEALDPYQADGLRDSPWKRLIGPEYVELAFKTLQEVDPNALMIINDYGFHSNEKPALNNKKRQTLLNLIDNFKAKGINIKGVGIQGHLDTAYPFDPTVIQGFIRELGKRGVKAFITELDVSDQQAVADPAERDAIVSQFYTNFLNAVLPERNVVSVNTWGLSDKYSWYKWFKKRTDGLPVRPLLYDSNYVKKATWFAVANALGSDSVRGRPPIY